ncbi:pilus assembly protein [Janthinobacterium sp. BJB401]|uniref:pilus assembly protein n=1 Tax=Janthinobacterium sp. BJB401 TaxID=2745934 RepID=UPI0015952B8D|nr:pilus assembly protein [Janthinobacterium sp. BJB401]NVI83391.1 pilus assembly protein [Janthinobacterium sp. BJB401]
MQHSFYFPVLLAALAASGCAATPNLDRQFGHSVAQLRARQVLPPQAGANRDPVAGIDGKAAQAAYAAYQKSFAAPAPQGAAFTIGVGTRP